MPDWLQTTTPSPAVPATDRSSRNNGAEDPGAGGLDWLQGLARPVATAVGGVPAQRHDEHSPAPTREQPAGGAPGDTVEEEVDWLGGALKGKIPSTSIKRTPCPETSTTKEADGSGNSAVGDDWLAIAKSSEQTKRKSPPSPTTKHSVAAYPATQNGWMTSGKLGLPTEDDSDEDGGGTTGGGGRSTVAAPAKPKKHKKQAGHSSPTAGGPAGWLGSGALGIPAEDDISEDDDDGGGGGSDNGRGVGVTIETQTEDHIKAVTEKGVIEQENASKLPPWAKSWVPPPKPEVAPETANEVSSAPAAGEPEKEVIETRCVVCFEDSLKLALENRRRNTWYF